MLAVESCHSLESGNQQLRVLTQFLHGYDRDGVTRKLDLVHPILLPCGLRGVPGCPTVFVTYLVGHKGL